jgi:hypothetical protein
MEKYILLKNGNFGTPSGYYLSDKGELIALTLPDACPVPLEKIDNNLFIILTEQEFLNLKNSKTMSKMNNTVVLTENVIGQEQTGRVETPFGGGQSVVTLQVGFDYSTPTAPGVADLSVLIGDAADMIKAKDSKWDNLAACVANGLVVTGTFGTRSVEILNKLAKNQVRFHTMQGEAAAASYWSNKVPMAVLSSNIQGNPNVLDVDFQINQDGSQFNDKIRQVPGFRFTISDFTAIQISVLEGEKVAFTFKVRSYGAAQIMELASA